MPQINFFNEECNFVLKNKKVIREWLIKAVKGESKSIGDLNFIFCSDEYLKKVNVDYLQHDYYTDIITFDTSEGTTINGDIFISIDRVKENAQTFKKTIINELSRIMIHGVLHLVGFKDKTKADKSLMTQKEDFYLSLHPLTH